MKISDDGIRFIKNCEGEVLRAYRDSVGVWTIGVGHTKNVKKGDVITSNQSTIFLLDDLKEVETALEKLIKVEVNQNQYDALCSLVFNIGVTAFSKSTLLRLLNQRQYLSASNEFLKWDKGTINGKKVKIKGLTIRRKKEQILFLS